MKILDWIETAKCLTEGGYEVILHHSGDVWCELKESEMREWVDFLDLSEEDATSMIMSEFVVFDCGESRERADEIFGFFYERCVFVSLWLNREMIDNM